MVCFIYFQAFRVFVPQLLILCLLVVYLVFGALIYQLIDEKFAHESFWNVVLFSFTTIATIGMFFCILSFTNRFLGYGNICPTNDASRLFTIFYAILGIPLCLLTLANLGKHLMKSYWMVLICLGRVTTI